MKCSDQLLKSVLDESEEQSNAVATEHIEHCAHCQQRIGELAADSDSWHEATTALRDNAPSSSIVIALDQELTEDVPVQADHLSLEFLGTPSHPEMLGRIGDYDIERVIGSGGMGIVFKAFDSELHRPVALKVLAPHLAHSGGARQRFAREAQSAAAVVHENVVPIHNVDTTGEFPFIVMQFVGGHSLQARVDRDGPLAATEVLRIGVQIAKGLAAAHEQGLVHRDVKPGNILLVEDVDRVLISDFGLARAADDASVTRSGFIAGTPHYMSPEQAHGDFIDCRSDLFGLGSVLYFMCTGRPPFRAEGAIAVLKRICHDPHRPVDEVNDRVPAELADLIDDLLAKEASGRPQSAEDVAAQLAGQLQGLRAGRGIKRRRSARSKKNTRVILWSMTTVVACGLAFGMWMMLPPSQHSVASPENAVDEDFHHLDSPSAASDASMATPTAVQQDLFNDSPVENPAAVVPPTSEFKLFPDDAFDEDLNRLTQDVRELEKLSTSASEPYFSTGDKWQDALDETTEMLEQFEAGQN